MRPWYQTLSLVIDSVVAHSLLLCHKANSNARQATVKATEMLCKDCIRQALHT